MYFFKIALIVLCASVFHPLAFSKPNPQLKEQKIKAQLEFVEHLIDRGEAKDALSMLEGLHQEYPEDRSILEVLSHFYFQSQQYPLAAFYLDKLYQVDPSCTPSLLLAAQSHAHMRNYPAAIHNYTLYLQHHPEDAPIWKNLGLLQQQVDNIKGAAKAYLKAFNVQRSSLSGEEHLQVAQWFLELENQRRAREFLTHALKEKEVRERALVQLIELDLREAKFSNAKQKLAILEGLNQNALTLYPIESLRALITEAEAAEEARKQALLAAEAPPSVETLDAKPEKPGSNPAAELALAELISDESPESGPEASLLAAGQNPVPSHPLSAQPSSHLAEGSLPASATESTALHLGSSFQKDLRLELSSAKPRAFLEPLPMGGPIGQDPLTNAAEETQNLQENATNEASLPEASLSSLLPSEAKVLEASAPCLSAEAPAQDSAAYPLPKGGLEPAALSAPIKVSSDDAEDERTVSLLAQNSNLSETEADSGFDTPAQEPSPAPEVPKLDPSSLQVDPVLSLEESLQQGQALEHNAHYKDAIAVYTRALEAHSQNAELFFRLSRAYFRDNQLAEAEKAAFSAMLQEPHSLAYTFHYLKIIQHTLPPEQFIQQLQKAKSRFPQAPELSLALARFYEYHLHHLNQALVFYKEFLNQAPADHPKRAEAEEALQRLL